MEKHLFNINIDFQKAYCAPQVSVIDFETEGVLCQSGGTPFGAGNEGYSDGGTTGF